MLAVSKGRLDMVKLLLTAGSDVNTQDEVSKMDEWMVNASDVMSMNLDEWMKMIFVVVIFSLVHY